MSIKKSVFEIIEEIELLYGPPMDVIASCLRGFVVAGPGKDLIAADFSAVEARVVAWLAGEESTLEVFRTHGKIYEKEASGIYGVPQDKVSKEQRQVGKVAVLALGFQGGPNAFQSMAKNYGVKVGPQVEDLWARAGTQRKEKAKWGWEQRGKKSGMDKREWMAAELIKLAWRESNPNIVKYWREVETASIDAVNYPGVKCQAGLVTYLMKGSFLLCRLPSGRCICYPYPRIKEVETPWGEKKPLLQYMTEWQKKWVKTTAYGGLLTENITQAVARDLLAEAILRCEPTFPVVMHLHDEIVCEIDEDDSVTVEDFERVVAEVPAWAMGLPIAAGGWRGKRFRKS